MKTVDDIDFTTRTVKRLLTRIEKQPVEVYPGYNAGLTLPPNTHVSIIAPISEILPKCEFDEKSDLFVSFTVYSTGSCVPLFEISWKKSGQYIYKNNQKFINPPLFGELFEKTHQIYAKNVEKIQETNSMAVDVKIKRIQDAILSYFAKHNSPNR